MGTEPLVGAKQFFQEKVHVRKVEAGHHGDFVHDDHFHAAQRGFHHLRRLGQYLILGHLALVLDGQLEEPVDDDAADAEGGQTGRRHNGTRQIIRQPEVANQRLDGLDQEGLSVVTNTIDKYAQRRQFAGALFGLVLSLVEEVCLDFVKDALPVAVEHGLSLLEVESVARAGVHFEQLLHCRLSFTHQLRIVFLLADFLFLAFGLPGVVDLLDVGPGLQHGLQSNVVGRAGSVVGSRQRNASSGVSSSRSRPLSSLNGTKRSVRE